MHCQPANMANCTLDSGLRLVCKHVLIPQRRSSEMEAVSVTADGLISSPAPICDRTLSQQ